MLFHHLVLQTVCLLARVFYCYMRAQSVSIRLSVERIAAIFTTLKE